MGRLTYPAMRSAVFQLRRMLLLDGVTIFFIVNIHQNTEQFPSSPPRRALTRCTKTLQFVK